MGDLKDLQYKPKVSIVEINNFILRHPTWTASLIKNVIGPETDRVFCSCCENFEKCYEKLGVIEKYGYHLIAEYDLSFEIWWNEYYTQLEKLVEKYKHKYPEDSQLRKEIESDRNQVNMCKSTPEVVRSFYIIIKKDRE